jgi:hypothetical protein
MEMSGQIYAPASLPSEEDPPVPIGWGPRDGLTLWNREISCTAGIRIPAIQPVARHYTD